MLRIKNPRRWLSLVSGIAVAGVFAGAVVAAQFGESEAPNELEAAIRSEPLVRVADVPAANGLAKRGVFVQPTAAGFLCLWDAPSSTAQARQGGCNPADDPFGGRELFLSFAYEGGPAASDVKDARLIGLVAPAVASVQVLMNDGTRRSIAVRAVSVGRDAFRAFAYRFKRADLRRGVAPTAVVALNEAGQEIDRQATGFAG